MYVWMDVSNKQTEKSIRDPRITAWGYTLSKILVKDYHDKTVTVLTVM